MSLLDILLAFAFAASIGFLASSTNVSKNTRSHLIERPETQWLHSNISNDSVLIWVVDSTKVEY